MRCLALLCVLALISGCSGAGNPYSAEDSAAVGAPQAKEALKAPAAPPQDQTVRKIIYTADISLSVEDFDKVQGQLKDLVKREKGYIANSEVGGTPGKSRWGRWKVRVPAGQLDQFLADVAALGEQRQVKLDSQDVTEEFYDLDARIRNKKIEEERLLKHLTQSTGKLEDILAVERELSRVRDEIERSQGRLRLLANLTDLTTITVTLHERGGYLPGDAPSYGTTLSRTFFGSINQLIDFGKNLLTALVAALPWLVVLALVALPLWRLRHRWWPTARPTPPLPAQEP